MNTPSLLTLNALALIVLAAFHFQPEPEPLPYTHTGPRQAAQQAVMTDQQANDSAQGNRRQTAAALTDIPGRLTF